MIQPLNTQLFEARNEIYNSVADLIDIDLHNNIYKKLIDDPEIENKKALDYILNMHLAYCLRDMDPETIRKKLNVFNKFKKYVTPDFLNDICRNNELYLLLSSSIIVCEDSIYVRKRSSLDQWIEYYELEDGDQIFITGVQKISRLTPILLASVYSDLTIYIYEPDKTIQEELLYTFSNFYDIIGNDRIHFVDDFSLFWESGESLDKILIPNNLHHVEEPIELLRRLKAVLSDQGELIIHEYTSFNVKACEYSLRYEHLKKILRRAGFKRHIEDSKQKKGLFMTGEEVYFFQAVYK